MSKNIAIFWPGDYRAKPNELALGNSRETTERLIAALKKLGRNPYVVDGYLTRPDESISKLGPIDDPMIGGFRALDLRAAHRGWRCRQGWPAAGSPRISRAPGLAWLRS